MSEIVRQLSSGSLTQFNPQSVRESQAKTDAVIQYAARIKDLSILEDAVDAKLDEQQEFVAWWDGAVRSAGNPAISAERGKLAMDDAEKQTGISNQQVSRWRSWLSNRLQYRAKIILAALKKAGLDPENLETNDGNLVQQSLSNEHYTPERYIEAARRVMGGIDLDPASCAEANAVVGAAKFFDIKTDGLKQEWKGRVWLNPPYGKMPGAFIDKLHTELKAGRVSAAIVLVNSHCTDAQWFQRLWDGALCFTDHRINFAGDEKRSGSTHGSVFVYFGTDRDAFVNKFAEFGAVVERVNCVD